MRTRQDRLQRHPDPTLEATVLSTFIIEVHQGANVSFFDRSTIGITGQITDNHLGTRAGLSRSGRPARENRSTCRVIRNPSHFEGAKYGEALKMLLSRHAITDANLPIRKCVIDRTNQIVDLTFKLLNKCGSNSLWPCSHIDGVCSDIQATGFRFHHPSVNRKECYPLAFD